MKTLLAPARLVIPADSVEMVYRALLHYVQALESQEHWMDDADAKRNCREEVAEYRQLSLDIYETHMSDAMSRPAVERRPRVGQEIKARFGGS
jgi:hypothetical protein